jgi:hypothetical protein
MHTWHWRPLPGGVLVLLAAVAGACGGQAVLAPPEGAVILTTSNWQEQAQRIFEDADIGEQLRHGEWVIMLHRKGCPEALALYRELASHMPLQRRGTRFALVEVSETDVHGASASTQDGLLAVGSVRRNRL